MSDNGKSGSVPEAEEAENEGEVPEIEEDAETVDVDDVEGDGEPDEGDETEGQAPGQVAPKQTRGSPRVQRLANENRELKQRVSGFERQLAELVQQRRQPTQAEVAEQERLWAENLEMMSPAQRNLAIVDRVRGEVGAAMRQNQATLFDQSDRQSYDNTLNQNPAYRRYDDRVQELKQQFPGVGRDALLKFAIGERAMSGQGAARSKVRRGNDAQVVRQTARPGAGRGDVAPERRGGRDDLEERLRGQTI